MSFKIGLVGLCTSHPDAWVPQIRDMHTTKQIDAEVVAAWDSGETRPAGFAREFCARHAIPHPVERLEELLDLVDGVIVHTTNWDRHIEQARPFVEAGKSVYLDKPVAGNLRDLAVVMDWMKPGRRVTGGSVLRYCREVAEYLAVPVEQRGRIHTAYTAIGVDDFNYGIHAYALVSALLGPGIRAVRYLGSSGAKQLMIEWHTGEIALLTIGPAQWLPFTITAVSDRAVKQIETDNNRIYRSMLDAVMPYFTGRSDTPPIPPEVFLEPELAALAARMSWQNNGEKIFLSDLRLDDPGYDGTAFAREYLRARLSTK